jgi:hypothetical protein
VQQDTVFVCRQTDTELYDIVGISIGSQKEPALGNTASCHKRLARDNLAWSGHTCIFGQSEEMLLMANEKLQPGTVLFRVLFRSIYTF